MAIPTGSTANNVQRMVTRTGVETAPVVLACRNLTDNPVGNFSDLRQAEEKMKVTVLRWRRKIQPYPRFSRASSSIPIKWPIS